MSYCLVLWMNFSRCTSSNIARQPRTPRLHIHVARAGVFVLHGADLDSQAVRSCRRAHLGHRIQRNTPERTGANPWHCPAALPCCSGSVGSRMNRSNGGRASGTCSPTGHTLGAGPPPLKSLACQVSCVDRSLTGEAEAGAWRSETNIVHGGASRGGSPLLRL
jgi:hypothetical protein